MGHSSFIHFHLITSPSTISIFHHHFSPTISPRKITSINPFHAPISLSFFNSIFLHIHIINFFFLIIHLLLSSHHHLNYAPCPFIEFRLVKNIDTLISKKKCINARCQKQFIYTANGLQSAFLFWRFEYCLRLTVKPSMEKHIALLSQPLSQSSTYQQLPEPWWIWMQPPLAQQ